MGSDPIELLLVEDDPKDALLIGHMLTDYRGERRFTISKATWLEEAVAKLREKHFDVALLDLDLPDTKGMETISLLQKADPLLPILVFTGLDKEGTAVQAVQHGAQDCLIKGKVEAGLLRRALLYAIERKHLTERLIQQNERLLELDKLKTEFVSVVTHELRTPLTAIQIALSLLEGEERDFAEPDSQASLDIIQRNTNRLIKLVNQALDVSRIEAGRLQLNLEDVDLTALVDEVTQLMAPQADQHRSRIVAETAGVPLFAQCDMEKILQVLVNLVQNAIQHNGDGATIRIGAQAYEGAVEVWVADDGKGIEADERHRIFQPYYQIQSASGPSKGTGLGLAISRGLVGAHKSRLELESEPSKGARFHFRLAATPSEEWRSERSETWNLNDLKVTAEQLRGRVRLALEGGLTSAVHHPLSEIVQGLLRTWSAFLVIDLSACRQIDSRGIGFLVECQAMAAELGGNVVLACIPPDIRKLLDSIGVLNAIPSHSELAAALRALESADVFAKGENHEGLQEHSRR